MGSVHAHKYGFPFQQPSTSCGTYTTLLVYRLATYLTIIILLEPMRQCYYIFLLSILFYYQYRYQYFNQYRYNLIDTIK